MLTCEDFKFAEAQSFETIREAQLAILNNILHRGELVDDTIELNNIVLTITNPLKDSERLLETLTKTGAKFYRQMMLEPDPKLEKTHYERLHDHKELTEDGSFSIMIQHCDQIKEVIAKLKEKSETRRAILTLWQPQDIHDPYALCWTFAQLLIRNNRLIMTVHFRSNDIFNAFPFNILGIAKLQEKIAEEVGVRYGYFNILIGSAHIYNKNIKAVCELLPDK